MKTNRTFKNIRYITILINGIKCKFSRYWLICLFLFFFAAGCTGSSDILGKEITVNIDGDKNVTLNDGQVLIARLGSNPTTGYSWDLENENNSVLIEAGEPVFVPSVRSDKIVGAGGITEYRFATKKKGNDKLVFKYMRPWEKQTAPAKRYVINVSVR
ncbi:MAG: protease inhibitor I42 family protein [Candidatus Omnitrophica bacterium]|nr:protease inhibitor I42 family protein [Candidatus Omnitrophota bacterium]